MPIKSSEFAVFSQACLAYNLNSLLRTGNFVEYWKHLLSGRWVSMGMQLASRNAMAKFKKLLAICKRFITINAIIYLCDYTLWTVSVSQVLLDGIGGVCHFRLTEGKLPC